jgi:hypothetical protein
MPPPSLRSIAEVEAWLKGRPSLEELEKRYPAEWVQALGQLREANQQGTTEQLVASLSRSSATRGRLKPEKERISELVRTHMIVRTLKTAALRAESGVESGSVRFSLLDGWILQKLFFAHDLVRKPVSLLAYSVVWPLARQRRRLMPLVRPKGIYCFYSSALIRSIARLTTGRSVLEIAAGDGTLSRFLRDAGVDIRATDDHSWSSAIDFGDVEKMDARTALQRYRPEAVVCSWPPAGNPFEKAVFETESVRLYIVITSTSRPNASDWDAYAAQPDFDMVEHPELGRRVLPRGSSTVLVFTRRSGT